MIVFNSYDPQDALKRVHDRIREFEQNKSVHLLLYAALDVRLCIERTLFEYLVLIKVSDLPRAMEKIYSAADLNKAILNEEPNFKKKMEFMQVYAQYYGLSLPITLPDLELLALCYGRANEYLHAPKKPDKTWLDIRWWDNLNLVLNKAMNHLVEIHSSFIWNIRLNERGQKLFNRFSTGELTKEELLKAFNIDIPD